MLALLRRHVAEHAVGATHLLLARRVHGAQVLRRTEKGLTLLRAEPFKVFVAADCALALVGRHCVQLMETIDQALLLLRRQAIESRLLAEGIFLTGKRLPLVILQPTAQMRTAHICRGCAVGSARCCPIGHARPIRWAGHRVSIGSDAGIREGTSDGRGTSCIGWREAAIGGSHPGRRAAVRRAAIGRSAECRLRG
jgi:hypothetical protein